MVRQDSHTKRDTHPHWFCCCALLPLPGIAPPNLPNCLPSPDFLAAGATGMGASFWGTGGARPIGLAAGMSSPSVIRRSPTPNVGPSSRFPPNRCARLARSWTLRNFSSSSLHRMMPSSRPLSRLGRSKDVALGVVAELRCYRVSIKDARSPAFERGSRNWGVRGDFKKLNRLHHRLSSRV